MKYFQTCHFRIQLVILNLGSFNPQLVVLLVKNGNDLSLTDILPFLDKYTCYLSTRLKAHADFVSLFYDTRELFVHHHAKCFGLNYFNGLNRFLFT